MEQKYIQQIAGKLNLKTTQVSSIHQMQSEGATIPFMARYRKEATGNLDEVVIGNVVEEIQYFNPIYKKQVIPAGGHVLTMPKSVIGKFVTNEEEIYAMLRKQSEEQKMLAQTQVKEIQITHTVRSGERLSTIARKYGVTVGDITTWNLVGKKGLRPGRKLVIYKAEKPIVPKDSASTKKPETNLADKNTSDKKLVAEATTTASTESTTVKEETYTVKQGDYFYKIAREHNISVDDLLRLNGLNRNSKLSAGQKLKLK